MEFSAVHDFDKSLFSCVSHDSRNVYAQRFAADEAMELLRELLVKVSGAVLAPKTLEWLELHHELPVRVQHAPLSLDQRAPIVFVAAIKDRTWLVVYAGHLEGLVHLLAQGLVHQVLRPGF